MTFGPSICRICWDPFVDKESPITSYSYQVYNLVGNKSGSDEDMPITSSVPVSLSTMEAVVIGLQLKVTLYLNANALLKLAYTDALSLHTLMAWMLRTCMCTYLLE